MTDSPQSIAVLIESLCDSIISSPDAGTTNTRDGSTVCSAVAGICSNREASLSLLKVSLQPSDGQCATLVSDLTLKLRWRLQAINQFAPLTDKDLVSIESSLRSWLDSLRLALLTTRDAAECLALMSPANRLLSRDVASLLAYILPMQGPIVSEAYSVETQLSVLNLAVAGLLEPVLDVGCGRDATLVKWLRGRGTNAIGLDVLAPRTTGCIVADWFQFPWLPEQFGTILAHLSFSLHFLHQHLRLDGDVEKHARLFMTILHSLKHGGRFAFAPGLPFVERHLPRDQFAVSHHAIQQLPIDENAARFLTQCLGESPMYACHIERV